MRFKELHKFDLTPEQAVQVQEDLRTLVRIDDDFGPIKTVAGVDVGFSSPRGTATGGVVVLTFPRLELIETASATEPVDYPYIPGLLAFRELPAILAAFEMIGEDPDLIMVDGQGLAHPRRFGIACHLGIILDRPTIGCGKSRLIGAYEEPGPKPGSVTPLLVGSEQVGNVLRTKERSKPLFISPGHRVGFDSAVKLVLECTKGYRLPEPTRIADRLVSHILPKGQMLMAL